MTYRTIVCLSGVLAALALSAPAHAQSSGAQAETLFRQGKDLLAKGQIAEACAAFDASQKLDPNIATLLNQAACREKNGQLATAWGLFLDAERQTRSATDAQNQGHHQTAAAKAAKLEPRLSTLTIAVPGDSRVAGLEVLRGGDPVDPGAWNRALPVDGGTYRITARAPGNAEWSSTITVGNEHDVKTIEIPKLKAAALESPVAASPEADRPAQRPGHPRSRVVPLVVGGAAVALAGGALGFELSARSTYNSSKTEVDNDKQTSLWHSANNKRYVAEGLGVAGLAAAGVAVWLYLRPGAEAPDGGMARIELAPLVAREAAGLVVVGGF
jgi:tetratricopeptide (TPR) repeat protein